MSTNKRDFLQIFYSSKMSKHIAILFFLLITHPIFAFFQNEVTSADIKTVRMHRSGWEISQPIINLGSNEQLLFSFDDLSGSSETYEYKIIHCTPDWEDSKLNPIEYIDGFAVNQIMNYRHSYTTSYQYVHYELLIPNRDIALKLSGNYILVVTKSGETNPIIIRRFYITESKVNIEALIRTSRQPNINKTHQELNFKIAHPNYKIDNPQTEIQTIIQQNRREDNIITNLKPQFIRPDELVYNYTTESSFEATNEFRYFDARTVKYTVETIYSADYYEPFYHFTLTPTFSRDNIPYFFRQDFDGEYVVNRRDAIDHNLEADYVFVHFTLPLDAPFKNATIHVIGEGFGWNASTDNAFQYNLYNKCYEHTALVKQGVYDYMIGVKEGDSNTIDFERFEGNYLYTENNYTIFIYQKTIADNHFRLIGVNYANSLHNRSIL